MSDIPRTPSGYALGAGLGAELSCPVCTKLFLRSTRNWAFRFRGQCVCSWRCLRIARGELRK